MLVGIGGVIAHELGHALVIKYRHRSSAIIALTAQVGTRHAPLQDSSRLMALCGPALEAAYALAVLAVSLPIHAFYFGVLAAYILLDSLYNLLPFKNFDGHSVFTKSRSPQS